MLNTIIASSDSDAPVPGLRGFAQVGGDFVLGESGRLDYGDVSAGHDGAYVSVVAVEPGKFCVGTDAAGYGRLFLYQRGHRWALGTSLMNLADHVRTLDWPLGVDHLQLKQFLFRSNMLVNQLLSLDTIFPEIRLIAPNEEVVVEAGVVPTFTVQRRETLAASDYESAMQDALDEMVGRLRTLITSGLPVSSAITGGRDSRAVLAALRLAHGSQEPIGEMVRFRSNERSADDWRIVKALSSKYGLRVNRATQATNYAVDPAHGFDVWRANDLGVYSAIYQFQTYTAEISLGGVGGETHRLIYSDPTLFHRLKRIQTPWVTDADVVALAARINDSLGHLKGQEDGRVEHYRQFRNRFHGGRTPLRTIDVAPLNSQKLKSASNLVASEHLDRAQLLADIMLNLAPDLAAEPYDLPEKSWVQKHFDESTHLRVDPDRYAGRVYGKLEGPPGAEHHPTTPLEPYIQAFREAAPAAVDSGLLPHEFVNEAAGVLEETKGKRFKHAVQGRGTSTVILAGQAAELTTQGTL